MDLIMGIDIGSTNTKAIAVDPDGRIVAEGSALTRLSRDAEHPTWTYWDPKDIWNGVKDAIAQVVRALGGEHRIRALACSCFSADFVPVDASGEPVYPFKSWHCPRTVPQMEQWVRDYSSSELLYRHGAMTEKLVSLFMMRWMWESIPDIARRTHKILLVSDYVNMKLTGEMVTDYTQAATSGAFDPVQGKWSGEFLGWAGFSEANMPTALLAGTPIGRVTPQAARETGLSEDVLVVVGAHDNECACFSLGMCNEDAAYNICGTWDMIMAICKQARGGDVCVQREIKSGRYILPDTYLLNKFGLAANFLEWTKDNFYAAEARQMRERGESIWDLILDETAKIPPLSNGILVLPFRAGASGKDRNQLASGTIMGMDNYLGRADVMHAVFECLGYQTRDFLENVEAACERRFSRVISVGGPTRNRQLMQIKADICNRPIEVTDVHEGTALGAAMVAGIGAGIYRDGLEAIDRVTAGRRSVIYTPNPENAARYQEAYQKYLQASELLSRL